jgi:hypothetical protein
MTNHFATRLMPAGNAQKSTPNEDRREVSTMALFESRQAAKKRASDRPSEIDKAVRLESVRRHRQHQADKAAQLATLFGLRSNR